MPKLKTRRSAAKRFSKTGTGKIKRPRANRRHLLSNRTSKRKRLSSQSAVVSPSDEPRIRQLIPYL